MEASQEKLSGASSNDKETESENTNGQSATDGMMGNDSVEEAKLLDQRDKSEITIIDNIPKTKEYDKKSSNDNEEYFEVNPDLYGGEKPPDQSNGHEIIIIDNNISKPKEHDQKSSDDDGEDNFEEVDIRLSNEEKPLLAKTRDTRLPLDPIIQLEIDMGGDLLWSISAFREVNWLLKSLGTWGEWLNQLGAGTAGALVASLGIFATHSKYRTTQGMVVLALYTAASILPIIPWNLGQSWGAQTGKDELGMSSTDAENFSSLYTSIIEAVIKVTLVSIISVILDPAEREKWQLDKKHVLQRATEFLANLPSGGVWQLVFTACYDWAKESIPKLMISGVAVSLTPAVVTTLAYKLAETINQRIEKYFDNENNNQDQRNFSINTLEAGP